MPTVSRLLGLIVIADIIRPGAGETLTWFQKQGVGIRIISGDDPVTVAAIAKRVGLDAADLAVDVSALSEEELLEASKTALIFGRVTPDRKKLLVECLKSAGYNVAMTGDGVNDIPALKAADCSIAMAGGAEAARHAAQLTLLTSDFTALPEVVAEGRRVVNNVTRAAALFLVKTLYSFALCILSILVPVAYPFQPIQLTLISTRTIGVPSFLLALELNSELIKGKFLRTIISRALPGAVAVTLCAVGAMLLEHTGWDGTVCSTLATLAAGANGLLMLGRVCWPLNKRRAAVLVLMTAGMVLAVALLGHVFFLVPLDTVQWAVLAGMTAGSAVVQLVMDKLMRR